MNGNGDVLVLMILVILLFLWYLLKMLDINSSEKNECSKYLCGYVRNKKLKDSYRSYFQEVFNRPDPTVKDCLKVNDLLRHWLLSHSYKIQSPNQCILERDYESLYIFLKNWLGFGGGEESQDEESTHVEENSLLAEMRKQYK